MKACSKCKAVKVLGEFCKRSDAKDGLENRCRACMKANFVAWRAVNPERQKAIQENWKRSNRDHHLTYKREYLRNRKIVDPTYKLRAKLISRAGAVLKEAGYKRKSNFQQIFGANYQEIHSHLIETAKKNYGGKYFSKRAYHIDHIIPLDSAKSEAELLTLLHYSNLQYLVPQHNRIKSNTLGWAVPNV